MLTGSSSDLPQNSLQIKQDDRFFSRLLSKESSMANPSFRVYYGVASGAVPFIWESKPGTPKNKVGDSFLPPLTPPPSFHFNFNKKPIKKPSKFNLIHTLFPRKTPLSPSPSSSSLSSSSLSSFSTPLTHSKFNGRLSSLQSSFDSSGDNQELALGSPTSTLCFGVGRETTNEFRGCFSMANMKNALSSIVSHGSGQGTA